MQMVKSEKTFKCASLGPLKHEYLMLFKALSSALPGVHLLLQKDTSFLQIASHLPVHVVATNAVGPLRWPKAPHARQSSP